MRSHRSFSFTSRLSLVGALAALAMVFAASAAEARGGGGHGGGHGGGRSFSAPRMQSAPHGVRSPGFNNMRSNNSQMHQSSPFGARNNAGRGNWQNRGQAHRGQVNRGQAHRGQVHRNQAHRQTQRSQARRGHAGRTHATRNNRATRSTRRATTTPTRTERATQRATNSGAKKGTKVGGVRPNRYPKDGRVANTNPNTNNGGTRNPRDPKYPGQTGGNRTPGQNTDGRTPRDPKNPGQAGGDGRTPGQGGDGRPNRDPKYPPGAGGDGRPPVQEGGNRPPRPYPPGRPYPGRPGGGSYPGNYPDTPTTGPVGPYPDGGSTVGGLDPRAPVGGGGQGGPRTPGRTAGTGGGTALSSVGSSGGTPPSSGPGGPPQGPRIGGITLPPANETRFVSNEVLVEFSGNVSPQALTAFAARHRLVQIETIRLALTNTVIFRGRIGDGRQVRVVLGGMSNDPTLLAGTMYAAQAQYLFRTLQYQGAPQQPYAGGNPPTFTPQAGATPPATPAAAAAGAMPSAMHAAQYILAKLNLPQAHSLSRGNNVVVAVIDSGIDITHPEIADVIAGTYDALGISEKPHFHGTAIAGAIAAHSQLEGVAPAARILAIRAFGAVGNSAEATTTAIIKGIEYALSQHARIINMSFAGPSDPGMSRVLERARAYGTVLVAASGNYGPNSPPQYPAADPNVIAVTATDANDNLFQGSNRGNHIAIAAPGVDILLPEPGAGYQLRTGTSFAAAHVSGIVALLLGRSPGLSPDVVRQILIATAHDLGAPGKDPQFGAGLADAYQALLAAASPAMVMPAVPAGTGPSTAAR